MRPRVYVAGPISIGDHYDNIHRAIRAGRTLMRAGYAPFVPHLDVFMFAGVGGDDKTGYEDLLETDLAFVEVCDALLRLRGRSAGADREAAFAQEKGIPVVKSMKELKEVVPVGKGRVRRQGLRTA